MPAITDPMDGLVSLQNAARNRSVRLQVCKFHPELREMVDYPDGGLRHTYALIAGDRVQASVTFLPAAPVRGVPCLSIGYAVAEEFRGKGLGGSTVRKAIEDMREGLRRNGVERFYIDAVVATANEPSHRLARRLISGAPTRGTDEQSGEPILHYLMLVE